MELIFFDLNNALSVTKKGRKPMRKEMYEELIMLGYAPGEAWEMISQMELSEDCECDKLCSE